MVKMDQAIDGYLASLDAVFPWEIRLVAQVSSRPSPAGAHRVAASEMNSQT